MTSNKKRVDPVRLGLAIGAILVLVTLLFSVFNGFSFDCGRFAKALDDGIYPGTSEKILPIGGLNIVSLSVIDMIKGVTVEGIGPVSVNGIRAAGILLLVATVIAAIVVYGIISKRLSYKTLKKLAIANAVFLVFAGALILLTRYLFAAEIARIMPEFSPITNDEGEVMVSVERFQDALGVKNPVELVFSYGSLAWGAIAAGTTAIIGAFVNVATIIYAKKNNLEI